MLFSLVFKALLPAVLISFVVQAAANVDLTKVGPSTPLSSKSKVCSISDYGGVADEQTDVGPSILSAFKSCAKAGGATLYIPPGNYSIATGVILTGGSRFAIQLDGLITLTSDGAFGGNAIVLKDCQDVEVFSSNGLGAINGQGYIMRKDGTTQNARLFRFISSTEISFHDIILVDAPAFHLVFNNVANLEAYHITIRGPDVGGSDGIDLICDDNCYIHHSEVTNRDECVSVKTPSNNVLIEEMFCNHSGGMSIGSLTADGVTADTSAAVSNITMRNIYAYKCTQMLMIKTFPGGSGAVGYVANSLFENFWAYDTTYGLDIDQYWYDHDTPNTGAVALSGLTFSNWTGTVDNGVSRAPIVIRGSDQVGITDIVLEDFNMWTVNGESLEHQCKNVYGSGYCARKATAGATPTFTSTLTVTATPALYTPPTKPKWGIEGYGTTIPIPIYTPAVMWKSTEGGISITASTVVPTVPKASTVDGSFKVYSTHQPESSGMIDIASKATALTSMMDSASKVYIAITSFSTLVTVTTIPKTATSSKVSSTKTAFSSNKSSYTKLVSSSKVSSFTNIATSSEPSQWETVPTPSLVTSESFPSTATLEPTFWTSVSVTKTPSLWRSLITQASPTLFVHRSASSLVTSKTVKANVTSEYPLSSGKGHDTSAQMIESLSTIAGIPYVNNGITSTPSALTVTVLETASISSIPATLIHTKSQSVVLSLVAVSSPSDHSEKSHASVPASKPAKLSITEVGTKTADSFPNSAIAPYSGSTVGSGNVSLKASIITQTGIYTTFITTIAISFSVPMATPASIIGFSNYSSTIVRPTSHASVANPLASGPDPATAFSTNTAASETGYQPEITASASLTIPTYSNGTFTASASKPSLTTVVSTENSEDVLTYLEMLLSYLKELFTNLTGRSI